MKIVLAWLAAASCRKSLREDDAIKTLHELRSKYESSGEPRKEVSTAWLGLISGFFAAFLFGGMAVATREVAVGFTASQIMLIRSVFAIGLVVVLDRNALSGVVRKSSGSGWLRSGFAAISAACFIVNIRDSSPTTAALFQQLTPCFVVLIGWLMANELLRPQHLLAALLATAGGLAIQVEGAAGSSLTIAIRGVVGALAGAASLISLRRACVKMSAGEVLLSLTIGQFVLSVCFAKFAWPVKLDVSAVWILVVCITYFLGNIALAASFRHCSTMTATIVSITATVWTGILDHLFSWRLVNLYTIFAYTLILAASVLCIGKERTDAG